MDQGQQWRVAVGVANKPLPVGRCVAVGIDAVFPQQLVTLPQVGGVDTAVQAGQTTIERIAGVGDGLSLPLDSGELAFGIIIALLVAAGGFGAQGIVATVRALVAEQPRLGIGRRAITAIAACIVVIAVQAIVD